MFLFLLNKLRSPRFMRRLNRVLTTDSLQLTYFAHFQSGINYGIIIGVIQRI